MLVRRMQTVTACLLACLVTCLIVPDAAAQGETSAVTFADGDYALQVPAAWPSQPPRSQMIQYEFQIPADEGNAGRLTMMSAGGRSEPTWIAGLGSFLKALMTLR